MDLAKELEIYYNMVYAEHICETKLVNLLIVIKEKSEKILSFASDYDYDANHAFNGYRSTVLFVVKFLEAVHCTKLNENFDGTVDEVILICIALNKTLTSVLQFHENSLAYHRKLEKNANANENENDRPVEMNVNSKECKLKMHTEDETTLKLQMPIDRRSLVDAFEAMQDNEIPFVFNKYYEFFYKGNNLNQINQTMLSNFLENFDPISWFKTLTSSTFTNTSLFLNIAQLGLTDSTFGSSQLSMVKNWLPFLSNTSPYIIETITIKRQLEWLICPITFELKHNPMKFQVLNSRKKFIKCKLLRNTVNSSGHLLIYFFSPDYFSKENDISSSFLSDWSLKLPGCSILVPELVYDKNEKFITPLQLQDCLDCYLWAIGKNNCANKIKLLNMPKQFSTNNSNESLKRTTHNSHSRSSSIGGLSSYFNNSLSSNYNSTGNNGLNSTVQYTNTFENSEQVLDGIPEHITLCGDSSGGNIATALLLVLNDIRTKFNYKNLKMPNSLVLAFTPFNLRDYSPIMLTSRFNYSLSPIIALTTVESNLPLPEIEDNDLITLNEPKNENLNKKTNKISDEQLSRRSDGKRNGSKTMIRERQKETIRQQKKKRTNSMNSGDKDDSSTDDETATDNEYRECDDKGSDSSDDLAYNSPNEELNLSYFARTLINYLSQYYTTHISTQMSHFEGNDKDVKLKTRNSMVGVRDSIENKSIADESIQKSTIQRKVSKNLQSDLEKMQKLNNEENESMIQNAFTMFRLFFNGNRKKSNEQFEWNKEIVEKIFTEQREKAFLDITRRPYISPAFYDDFQSLQNVSIYLLNSTCDMFLDDNICMAKKWKGRVTLKVLNDQLPRGFLIERFLQDAKEGQLIFFKMVKDALELKKPLPKFLQQN